MQPNQVALFYFLKPIRLKGRIFLQIVLCLHPFPIHSEYDMTIEIMYTEHFWLPELDLFKTGPFNADSWMERFS